MRERSEIISNLAALVVTASLAAIVALAPTVPAAAPQISGGNGVEIAMGEAPPEPPKPEPPAPAAPAAPEPPAPAEPSAPESPPPEPKVEETAQLTEEPPKPVEMLIDEEGETSKVKALPVVSEEVRTAFNSCLGKHAKYPTSKEALKTRPRGVVRIRLSVTDGAVAAIEITQTSGSPILDQAARSSVLNSPCGKVIGSGVAEGSLKY